MNWRTDKPTANVIVAFIGRAYPRVLVRDKRYNTVVLYNDTYGVQFTEDEIEKWADLEEEKRCKTNIDREEQISQVADILFYNTETRQLSVEKCYELAEKIVTKRGVNLREDETVTDRNELEEEIDNYIGNHFSEAPDGVLLSDASRMELAITDVAPMARHFAKWGAEHLKKIEK